MAAPIPAPRVPAFVVPWTFIPVIVLTVLATIAVGLRILALRAVERRIAKPIDLWLIIAGLIVVWGDTIEMIIAAAHGGITYSSLPLRKAAVFFTWIEFANVPLNTTAMALVRLSVLQFYKSIFVTRVNRFKWVSNGLIALVVAWWFIGFIPAFASLSKRSRFNHERYILAVQGMAIALDCLIILLPAPLVWKLHLSLKRKLRVLAILWLGSSCIAFAGLRYYFLAAPVTHGVSTNDFAYVRGREADLWGRLEPAAGIIAACLPTYGPLVKSRFIADALRSVRSLRSIRTNSSVDDNVENATHLKHIVYQNKARHSALTGPGNAPNKRSSSPRLEPEEEDEMDDVLGELNTTEAVRLEQLQSRDREV